MNLKRIALLNSITSGLEFLARLLVSFILNPIIVSSLGTYLFGVWKILGQLNSYMATGDIRAATSLKWIISKERNVKSNKELSITYSTALFSFLLLLPVYILIGIIIMYFVPSITKVTDEYKGIVVATSLVLILTFILTQFIFLYESLLQAMNLAYKRIGVRAIIILFGGVLSVILLKLNYSIISLALVQLLVVILTGLTLYYIAKKNIIWLKILKVKFKNILEFTSLSVVFFLQRLGNLANISSDLLLLGYFAGPIYVAQYTFTMFAMTGLQGIVTMISTSILPGLGSFWGEKNYSKIYFIRNKIIELKRFLLTIGAVIICLLNKSFVTLWIEDGLQYAGNIETYIINLIIIFRTISLIDKSFLNISLNIKKLTIYTILLAVVTCLSSALIIPILFIKGLLFVLLINSILENIINISILKKYFIGKNLIIDIFYSRTFIYSNILILLSMILSQFIFFNNWLNIILFGFVLFIFLSALYYFVILSRNNRLWFKNSILTSLSKK